MLSNGSILKSTPVVVFVDTADSGYGKAKAGAMPSGASLTASTPAAYGSVAGATKVGFAGWLNNPSA